MVKISQAKLHNTEAIKVFYSKCGYGGDLSTLEEDLILIAQLEEKIVGAVRLCPDTGFFVLRGMQVLAPFQRQGVGTQLLKACTDQLVDQVCYCIPWQHLRSFYQEAGFQVVAPIEVPDLLRERFENYISRGMNVVLMCRLPASSQVVAPEHTNMVA
ncbi:GNAT family N-acetyltransferase [Nostoc sp. MG11]|uniref:GNAT family N-acetyltransferase n=1 Tax=Nostoc sp. MG11 TaxID=2721166 RepID=UPI001865F6C3|nr:GNAT family N-acetyltransferase [Nostoc sp. MG11]